MTPELVSGADCGTCKDCTTPVIPCEPTERCPERGHRMFKYQDLQGDIFVDFSKRSRCRRVFCSCDPSGTLQEMLSLSVMDLCDDEVEEDLVICPRCLRELTFDLPALS